MNEIKFAMNPVIHRKRCKQDAKMWARPIEKHTHKNTDRLSMLFVSIRCIV